MKARMYLPSNEFQKQLDRKTPSVVFPNVE